MNWKFPDYKRDLKKRVDAQPATGGGSNYVPPEKDVEAEGAGGEMPEVKTTEVIQMREAAQSLASRPSISGAWADEADHVTLLAISAREASATDRKNALEEIITYLRRSGLRPHTTQDER